MNEPVTAKRWWEVDLRLERGKLSILRAVARSDPRGKKILRMAGPFRLALVGRKGELEAWDFAFPLLGPPDDDAKLLPGLTAETRVVVPHLAGLRELVATGPDGSPKARKKVRRRRLERAAREVRRGGRGRGARGRALRRSEPSGGEETSSRYRSP